MPMITELELPPGSIEGGITALPSFSLRDDKIPIFGGAKTMPVHAFALPKATSGKGEDVKKDTDDRLRQETEQLLSLAIFFLYVPFLETCFVMTLLYVVFCLVQYEQ